MWLRRLVGAMMILTLIGMNTLVVVGLVAPEPKKPQAVLTQPAIILPPAPVITLSVEPSTIPANTTSALKWTTTGNPTDCTASGTWSGAKTAFGAESTGRLMTPGNFTFTLTCSNAGGKAQATATITVGNAKPPARSVVSTSTPSGGAGYCYGRVPCYSKNDVASHGSAGNCWGWNVDRVINISGFDSAFHQAKSGLSTIEVSGVCGKDLSGALNGSVGASGNSGHAHLSTTKSNSDKNEIPYFVGYFDSAKP